MIVPAKWMARNLTVPPIRRTPAELRRGLHGAQHAIVAKQRHRSDAGRFNRVRNEPTLRGYLPPNRASSSRSA